MNHELSDRNSRFQSLKLYFCISKSTKLRLSVRFLVSVKAQISAAGYIVEKKLLILLFCNLLDLQAGFFEMNKEAKVLDV